jgi:hypothetical protein
VCVFDVCVCLFVCLFDACVCVACFNKRLSINIASCKLQFIYKTNSVLTSVGSQLLTVR